MFISFLNVPPFLLLAMQKLINALLGGLALLLQIPMLIFHWMEIEQWLGKAQSRFNKPDNVSSNFLYKDTSQQCSTDSLETVVSKEGPMLTEMHHKVINSVDIVDIVHAHGYKVHEHVVQTKDGYLLSIHRIIPKSVQFGKKVVYMHHGLLTNSELFVLGDKTSKCLPFRLVDEGYDVWLGNNRGNKYSRKHLYLSSKDVKFWDYSLDEFAMFDIPNTIDHILNVTQEENLVYIGFSQGSAQGLAALSLNDSLNTKIKYFIGLSPAMIPKGLNNPICSFLVKNGSRLLYMMFGHRAILPSVVFWQKIMGPLIYEQVVNKSLVFLFNWKSNNISQIQKQIGYPHMFSPSSVKTVVHWFQIIKSKRFQMFNEGGASGSKLVYFSGTSSKTNRVASFPTQTIKTPCLLFYGTDDMLIDIDKTVEALNCKTEIIELDGYEHMDTLWAVDVESKIFNKIVLELNRL